MRVVLTAALLVATVLPAIASEVCEPRPQSYQPYVTGPRRDVEAAPWEVKFAREQYVKIIKNLQLDENKPILPECVLPVQVTLQYWAANARQDIATYKGIIPDQEYDMMRSLTLLDFVNLDGNRGSDKVLTWRVNYLRLRDECANTYARKRKEKADAEALQSQIIRTEGGVRP